LIPIVRSRFTQAATFHLITGDSARIETQELCVNDICVARDQFAEVFGNQSAAAGAPGSGVAPETAGGLPPEGPDGGPLIEANNDNSATTATSTLGVPAAANDNESATSGGDYENDAQEEAGEPEAQPNQIAPPHGSTPLIEDTEHTATTPDGELPVPSGTPEPDAANDNGIGIEELPATGTD
jgi:hypothetical protein